MRSGHPSGIAYTERITPNPTALAAGFGIWNHMLGYLVAHIVKAAHDNCLPNESASGKRDTSMHFRWEH